MIRKVWAVSSGSYSDYRVHAIFSTEAAAQKAHETDTFLDVEEYELYDDVPERQVSYHIRATRNRAGLRFDSNVTMVEGGWYISEWQNVNWPWDYSYHKTKRPEFTSSYIDNIKHKDNWTFQFSGSDQQAVRRAVYDKVRELNDRLNQHD